MSPIQEYLPLINDVFMTAIKRCRTELYAVVWDEYMAHYYGGKILPNGRALWRFRFYQNYTGKTSVNARKIFDVLRLEINQETRRRGIPPLTVRVKIEPNQVLIGLIG